MSWQALVQALVLVVLLAATVPFLGRYMADVYGARPDGSAPGDRFFGPIERAIYRLLGVDAKRDQRWNVYAVSLVAFSLVSVLVLYGLHRLQGVLPLNPTDRPGVSPMGSFNAAISFVTNTNWQWYSGELSISNLTNMLGNTVQNFVSAAAGMVVAIALIRGITRTGSRLLGNFWVDLVRTLLRILLPLSLVFAVVLISQGVIQNLGDGVVAVTVDQTPLDAGDPATAITEQAIPGGPLASQEAIKELGTNGGGFFNANSAHPFSNPNGVTNILQIWALLLIPFSMVVAFGRLVKDKSQARVLIGVMATILIAFSAFAMFAEQNGNPNLTTAGADQSLSITQSGGNMEGKEVRIGAPGSGSVRRRHDRHIDRCREQHARLLHPARRPLADAAHDVRRGVAGRRRRRVERHVDPRPARRVHRRVDGRTDTRVPGQEDPGTGDEARDVVHPGDAVGPAALRRARPSCCAARRPTSPTPMACRRCSTTSPPPPTTTARRSPSKAPAPSGTRRPRASRC